MGVGSAYALKRSSSVLTNTTRCQCLHVDSTAAEVKPNPHCAACTCVVRGATVHAAHVAASQFER